MLSGQPQSFAPLVIVEYLGRLDKVTKRAKSVAAAVQLVSTLGESRGVKSKQGDLMKRIVHETGDALINANASFPNLAELESDFDMLFFLDFCTGLDAAVVQNRLHTVGVFPGSTNMVALALLREGVIKRWDWVSNDPIATAHETTNHPRAKALLDVLPSSVQSKDLNTFKRVAAAVVTNVPEIVIELEEDLPLIPVTHLLPAYLRLPDVSLGERILRSARKSLTDIHGQLGADLLAKRARLDGPAYIPLPPIALEVLDKADNLEQVGEVLLDSRRRYDKVREYFRELDETLTSDTAPLSEKCKAEAKLTEAIRRLLAAGRLEEVNALGSLAKSVLDIVEFEYKIGEHGEPVLAFPLGRILEKVAAVPQWAYLQYRLRPMYSTVTRYLDTNAAQIKRIIHKHFHYKIGTSELELGRSYAAQVDDLLQAMSPIVAET